MGQDKIETLEQVNSIREIDEGLENVEMWGRGDDVEAWDEMCECTNEQRRKIYKETEREEFS